MLEFLRLENVGPAPLMELELASRLNLITGDNGLGKSFLLDVMWWALTRKWPQDLNAQLSGGYPARPTNPRKPATLAFRLDAKVKSVTYESHYGPRDEAWLGKPGRPWNPGLVIYAHADGGFSVWDPARNYWKKKGNTDIHERLPGYVFSPREVWQGLEVRIEGANVTVCNGLLRDWASWIKENQNNVRVLSTLLEALSPTGETLELGPLTRPLSVNDARDIPSLKTGYADAVPVLFASSGVRRIMALAYMLQWSWNEHHIACEKLGEKPTSQVIMLIDEIESHLHPRWQRSVLKSLLSIMKALHASASIQLIAATHSPLILASAEPFFDPQQDAWFDLDLDSGRRTVVVEKRPFVRRGTAGRWLTSPAFDLASEGRSLEAEAAIQHAEDLLKQRREGGGLTRAALDAANAELRRTLSDVDSFWVRWSHAFETLCQEAES